MNPVSRQFSNMGLLVRYQVTKKELTVDMTHIDNVIVMNGLYCVIPK